jgi:hypothetical protein
MVVTEQWFDLLKAAIAATPHDERNAFKETDLVASLARLLPPMHRQYSDLDDCGWIRVAEAIITTARQDDGTPPNGMVCCEGFEYPYCPDQLASDGNGYLIRKADATLEFLKHELEVKKKEVTAQRRMLNAANN